MNFDALKKKSTFILLDRLIDGTDIVWLKSKKKNFLAIPTAILAIKNDQIIDGRTVSESLYANDRRWRPRDHE